MESQREQRIRERAHSIWEEEGRPEGRESDHWDRAAREIAEIETQGPANDAAPGAPPGPSTELRPGGTLPAGETAGSADMAGSAGDAPAPRAPAKARKRKT